MHLAIDTGGRSGWWTILADLSLTCPDGTAKGQRGAQAVLLDVLYRETSDYWPGALRKIRRDSTCVGRFFGGEYSLQVIGTLKAWRSPCVSREACRSCGGCSAGARRDEVRSWAFDRGAGEVALRDCRRGGPGNRRGRDRGPSLRHEMYESGKTVICHSSRGPTILGGLNRRGMKPWARCQECSV